MTTGAIWGAQMHLDRVMKEATERALLLPRQRVKIICAGENTRAVNVMGEWFCERCGETVKVCA